MKKETALDVINELPHEFELDELLEKLIFIEKVEDGLNQLEEGKSISHDDLKKSIEKW